MASHLILDGMLEVTARRLVESGHYASIEEVIGEGIRLVDDRERSLATLQAGLKRSIADADAGRVRNADEVFDELKTRFRAKADDAAGFGSDTIEILKVIHGARDVEAVMRERATSGLD